MNGRAYISELHVGVFTKPNKTTFFAGDVPKAYELHDLSISVVDDIICMYRLIPVIAFQEDLMFVHG